VTPGLFFTCHTPKIKGGLRSQGKPVSFLDPAAFPPPRLTRSTSTYPGDAAQSSRKETTGMRARTLPGFGREQCFRSLPFAFSARSRRFIVADPMWRSAAPRGSGSMVPLLSRACRRSGIAACSLPPQNSPARWYTQTSASTTTGPSTCFRCLRQGEGLVGTSVTPPRTTRFV